MGFVDDSPATTPTSISRSSSALSTIPDEESATPANGKPASYLYPRKHRRHVSLSKPRTPATQDDSFYPSRMVTESEEIWEELEDETLAPLSPFHHRRSSARSTPSRDRHRPPSGDGHEEDPNESTALLARSGTGRSYRDRRRRRSAPQLEGSGRSQASDRRRSSAQQDALGGWWKMRWWKKDKEDGEVRPDEG